MRFLRKLTQHEDHLFTICKLLFSILEIKVTNTSLKDKINNHKYFPSLLTITNTLNTFGVSSTAIKMGNNHLEDLDLSVNEFSSQEQLKNILGGIDYSTSGSCLKNEQVATIMQPVKNAVQDWFVKVLNIQYMYKIP